MATASNQQSEYRAGPPSPTLAAIGAAVSKRLAAVPRAERVLVDALDLYTLPNFLSGDECATLIAMIDATSQPSTLFAGNADPEFRTSYSGNLDRWNPKVMAIDARIYRLLGLAERQGETLQGQRYTAGQQFKSHHDFFHINQPYWQQMEKQGGQRSWTAMIYLNEPEAGGETGFPKAGIGVRPMTGLLLAWNNMAADGSPNLGTLHAGLPVKAGTKYIVTKWFREGNWY